MSVVAVLSQTPGRGWRWSTEDTGVTIHEGVVYHATSALAEAEAEALLGSDWPGTPSEGFATISDAEGEGWHYVGESGEPAFGTDWSNVGSPWPALAFRMRQPGIVDLVGAVTAGASATNALFTLPEGYRPNEQAFMPHIRQRSGTKSGQLTVVNDSGNVEITDSDDSGDYNYIAGSFFIDTAAPL